MTRISNKLAYPLDVTISDEDYVIGTDGDNLGKITRNYNIGDLRRYINSGLSPEVGGTLKVSEITYNGVLTSPSEVANALDPNYQVLQYHIVIFSVNGNKYILKEQDITLGLSGTAITDEDFILIIGFTKLGDGTNVLKGYNTSTGLHEFYSIKKDGNLLNLTESLGNIVISIDETELSEFIKENGKTYSVLNVGTGVGIYKDTTVVGDNTNFNFKSIKSNTLNIELTDADVFIYTPKTASIPALYVNNLYEPSYSEWLEENKVQNGGTAVNGFVFRGKGTLAQPFTDSTVYLLAGGSPTITPNTAIQNALDGDSAYNTPYSFIGMGSDVAPQKAGQQIKVQDNIVGYNFTGNINLNQVNIVLEENVVIYSNPSIGDFLVDYDTLSPTQALSMSINLKEGAKIVLAKSGFRNSGTSTATSNFSNCKQISISGNGTIFQNSNSIIANDYVIIESNYTTTNTFNNDAATQFIIDETTLMTNTQSIYKVGGNSIVNFSNGRLIINGITGLPASTEIFNQIGGVIRMNNLNISVTPFFGTILNKVFPISKSATIPSELNMSNITLSGGMNTIIENESALQPTVSVTNLRTIDFQCSNIVKSPSVLWTNCFLNNNVIVSGVVDFTQVDLTLNNTVSCVNSFSGNVVESLRVFQNKSSAIVAGALLNSAFIKRNVFNAVDLIAGVEYKVVTPGSPSLGAVGSFFTATGSETGTGRASLETREILT